ncbi:MAG TPA: FkbM family methyltransferase, partial [Pyrinomonadaceae bacterium]|nr:FkbM family methyltransferase [Pyrinomonadaceae bacterium]
RSRVFNCALVPFDYTDEFIRLTYGADLSFVEGAYEGERRDERERFIRRYRAPDYFVVPARTLTSVLDEAGAPAVDFLSLDVEGFELGVLRGLDFDRHEPAAMLIECQTAEARDAVNEYLARRGYALEAKLTRHDYLFTRGF